MSIDSLHTLNLSDANLLQSSSHHPLLLRLRQALISCSSAIESGDFQRSDKSIGELVDFLNSVTDAVVSEPDDDSSEHDAFQVVMEIHRYVTSPSLDQNLLPAKDQRISEKVAKPAAKVQELRGEWWMPLWLRIENLLKHKQLS